MASGRIPSGFRDQVKLQKTLRDWWAGLPAVNVLTPLLISEGIDMDADAAVGVVVLGLDDSKTAKEHAQHQETELRDKDYDAIVKNMLGGFQFLKHLNPSNKVFVGGWGAPVLVDGAIHYPPEFAAMMLIFNNYYEKDHSYAVPTSPLQPYNTLNNIDMAVDFGKMGDAITHNTNMGTYAGQAHNFTETRDTDWEPVLKNIIKIYNYLKALYINNVRALEIAGFVVVKSPPSHVVQTSTALQSENVRVHGAVRGTILYNLENFDVFIVKGQDPLGTQTRLAANSAMAIEKGMSVFYLINPDPLKIAKIHTTVSKSR
jgi:hypothetical protein